MPDSLDPNLSSIHQASYLGVTSNDFPSTVNTKLIIVIRQYRALSRINIKQQLLEFQHRVFAFLG